MGRKAKAAVCREMNKPVVVEEIEIESPGRDQVMIKLSACGVCHSDLSATNGTIKFPLPLIIGHEGAGVVVEVGESVTDLAVGDHVISSFVTMRQVSVLHGMTLPLRSGRQRIIHASRRVGAVLNTARMEAGSSAIVFGAGGVGLNTIQGCVIAGARTIVAVDTHDSKLELAASGSVKSTPSSILVSAAW